MSAPQPARQRQPARKAPAAIRQAKDNPSVPNAIAAIDALHEDMVANQRYQRDVNVRLETGISRLEKGILRLETGISSLLEHHKLPPLPQKTRRNTRAFACIIVAVCLYFKHEQTEYREARDHPSAAGRGHEHAVHHADCRVLDQHGHKLLVDAGTYLGAFQDDPLRDLPCTRLEVDEAWAFVYAKNRNVPLAKQAGDAGYLRRPRFRLGRPHKRYWT